MNPLWFALAMLVGQTPQDWVDTHRLLLRNGNFIEGVLEELTADYAVVKYAPGMRITIALIELKRSEDGVPVIEEISIRHVNAKARTVAIPGGPTPTPVPTRTPSGATAVPVIEAERAGPPPAVDPALRGRLEEGLQQAVASPAGMQALKEEVRAGGRPAARYLLWRSKTVPPELVANVFESIQDNKGLTEADLEPLITFPVAEVRAGSIRALADGGHGKALRHVGKLVADADAGVRIAAVELVEKVGSSEYVQLLSSKVNDPDAAFRTALIRVCTDLARKTKGEPALKETWSRLLPQLPEAARPELSEAIKALGP